jgi:hypothetical protein
MNVSFSDIIERMKRAGGLKNDTAVARRLGLTPQAVSNCRKKGKMPPRLILRFAELYGLSVDWLLTGRGEMYRAQDFAIEGYVPAPGTLDTAADRKEGTEERYPSLSSLSPDEIIYVGKVLKILRCLNKPAVDVLKLSVDALLGVAESS